MTIDDKEGSHYNNAMMCEPKLSSSPSIVRIAFPKKTNPKQKTPSFTFLKSKTPSFFI
jgi:hypothetical protein